MPLPQWTPAPGYTDLSLKQIRDEFGCTPIIPTPEITVPRPPLSPDVALPLPVRISFFSVTPNLDETTNKSGVITFTISDRANLSVYAKIYHISTSDNDFVGSIKWTVTTDSGTLNFTVNTDNKTELLTEQFQVAFTVDEDNFDTAFFVSDPINIADTSKFPVWNPTFIPGKDVIFTVIPSGSLGDLRVKDAKPSSTFTGTVKYEGSGTPFTPNPKTITVKTVGADGTAIVDSFYNVVGKYTYDIIYDNFAPDVIYDGTGRSFVAEVKQNLGTWKVIAVSNTVEGGQSLKFNWDVNQQTSTSLTAFSYYIVNIGSNPGGSPPIAPVTYTGTGIPDTGKAFNLSRTISTFNGDFTISTSEVTTNQKFVLMLYAGEIVNSAFLAASQEITIQPKPPIPDLVVSGEQVVLTPNTVEWTVSGSNGEKVDYLYLDLNKNKPYYNIYFDYYPDVAAQFAINNYGKSDPFLFAEWHYDVAGKKEGRYNPDQLKAINDSLTGTSTITLGAVPGNSYAGSLKIKVQQGRQLLPRTSPYTFAFKGDKALNVKYPKPPIQYSLTVKQKPALSIVRESNLVPYGYPVDVKIFGPFYANVSFTGPTNGFTLLSGAGSGSVDLRQGTNLTVNTHTWKFTSNIDCDNNNSDWSVTVQNFLLTLSTKTAAQVPGGGWQGSGNSFTINLIRDYQGLISPISNPVIVFKGYPTGTATLSANSAKDKNPDYVMTFAANGEATMPPYLSLGQARDQGTVVFTLTSQASTSPITITVITQTYDENIFFSLTGTPTQVSPFTMNVNQEFNWRMTGGVPNTEFTRTWVHDEKGAAGLPGLKLTDNPAGLTYKFDGSGNYQEERNWFPSLSPGAYYYTFNLKATGKVLKPIIYANNYEFTVTMLPQAITGTTSVQGYDRTRPIIARITSFPGDTITINRPIWSTYRMLKNYHGGPVGYFMYFAEEGQDPNHLIAPYPRLTTSWHAPTEYLKKYNDVKTIWKASAAEHYKLFGYNEQRTWPLFYGYPEKQIVIPNSGIIEVDINGDANKSITVQSSHFNMEPPSRWGVLDSYIKIGNTRTSPSTFTRGLTIAVIHPNTLELEFQQTYDTYGNDGTWGPFADKINSIPTGKIVVVVSYDAMRFDNAMAQAMNTRLGTNFSALYTGLGNVYYNRANMLIIGYAGEPSKLMHFYFNYNNVENYAVVFPPTASGGQGAPFLSSYNRESWDTVPDNPVLSMWNYDKQMSFGVRQKVISREIYRYSMKFESSRLQTFRNPTFNVSKVGSSGQQGPLYDPCIATEMVNETCPVPVPDPGIPGDPAGELSDIRLKSNIQRIDTHPLGFGIYEYDIFDRREQGVLAQEVLLHRPDAVSINVTDGYYRVNYNRLNLVRKIISIK